MTNKKSKPEIIDGYLASNVVPFEKPKKKIAQDQFDVEFVGDLGGSKRLVFVIGPEHDRGVSREDGRERVLNEPYHVDRVTGALQQLD